MLRWILTPLIDAANSLSASSGRKKVSGMKTLILVGIRCLLLARSQSRICVDSSQLFHGRGGRCHDDEAA